MPIIKIARARTLDPDVHGIPMCAQTHMLTLPWLHLTKETGDMVMNHPD